MIRIDYMLIFNRKIKCLKIHNKNLIICLVKLTNAYFTHYVLKGNEKTWSTVAGWFN